MSGNHGMQLNRDQLHLHKTFSWRKAQGFSLVELLVVVSVTALFMTILLPALGAGRESARQAKCGSNMRQLGIAYMSYINDNKGWTVNSGDFYKPIASSPRIYRPSHFRFWARFTVQTNSNLEDAISPMSYAHLARLWKGYFSGSDNPTELNASSLDVFNCPSAETFALNKSEQSDMTKIGSTTAFNIPYYMRGVPQGAPAHISKSVGYALDSSGPMLSSATIEPGTPLMGDMTGFKGRPGNHNNVLSALYADGQVKRFRHPAKWVYDQPPHYSYGKDRTTGGNFPGAWSQLAKGELQSYQ